MGKRYNKKAHVVDKNNDGFKSFNPSYRQRELGKLIDNNTLIFVEGCAGAGKTAGILYKFLQEYTKDVTKKLVIIRTPVEAGEDRIGFLPSDLNTKIAPHFNSTRKLLEMFLDKDKVGADLNKRIFFEVPNYILGDTLDDSLILIDEVQQLSSKTLKLLLERIGVNSTCVVAGDPSQLYVNDKKRNALTDAVRRFFIEDRGILRPRYENTAHFKFGVEDVMRSDIVKTVIKAYSDSQ